MVHFFISNFVAWISEATGLGTEQISFVACMLMSFAGAFIFRGHFHPSKTSYNTRLLVSGLFGVFLLFFSWGWKIFIPLADMTVTYMLLKFLDPKIAHKVTFVFSMLFLFSCHLHHLYNFNKIGRRYSTDFTGPNMIMTQRITSLAFSIHDGLQKKESELNDAQKKYAVRKFPTFLEYFSYIFGFTCVVAGPLVFYQDYISFISGTNYQSKPNEISNHREPSPLRIFLQKFSIGAVMAFIYVYGSNHFPYMQNIDEAFIENTNFFSRVIFLYVSLFVCRAKYYLAWSFADAVCNAAGLGFSGFDENNNPTWNAVSNINIKAIETSTSLKVYIDNWNIMTGWWLRRVCYDRAPKRLKMLLTFILSAVWHGFFPGYYMTFLSGHLFTLVQRKFRKNMRPMFQTSSRMKHFYEVITWFATHLCIAYVVVPFVVLEFWPSVRFYQSCYFCGHILGFLMLLLIPKMHKKFPETSNGHANGNLNGKIIANHFSENNNFDKLVSSANGHLPENTKQPIENGVNGDALRHR